MPKVKKERTKYHHAASAKKADSSDDEDLKELGLVFKGRKKSNCFQKQISSSTAEAARSDRKSFFRRGSGRRSNVDGIVEDEL